MHRLRGSRIAGLLGLVMRSLGILGCVLCLASFGCVPARTLIIRVPAPARPGKTFACKTIDASAQSTTNPALQNTCLNDENPPRPLLTTNSDPVNGVPDNHPNTRYVFAPPDWCDHMYEVRILDPDSKNPRVTVTCDKNQPTPP